MKTKRRTPAQKVRSSIIDSYVQVNAAMGILNTLIQNGWVLENVGQSYSHFPTKTGLTLVQEELLKAYNSAFKALSVFEKLHPNG